MNAVEACLTHVVFFLYFIIISGKCCECCHDCCKAISDLFDRPFSCWAVFAFFILGAGGVIAIIFAAKNWDAPFCSNNLPVGLLIIGICYFVQNFANFYIVYKYAKEYGKYGEFEDKRGDKGICEVTWKFLCYDFFMCFYMFFLPFSLIWTGLYVGYARSSSTLCQGILLYP